MKTTVGDGLVSLAIVLFLVGVMGSCTLMHHKDFKPLISEVAEPNPD